MNTIGTEDDEDQEQACPDQKDLILARIHQMKPEGVVFQSIHDIPDEVPQRGYTMFNLRSRFGGKE